MWTVELKLDETLARFEVQDWINDVFSVQFPDIEAKIKTGCQGNCGDKYKAENEQLKLEKCELLGIIQKKDELINKLICCDNCKHFNKVRCCRNDDKCIWELAE